MNFRKFKVTLNPLRRIFFKLCKKLHLIMLITIKKWGSPGFFLSYKRLKLKLRVFLAGHIIAMVTYCITKIIPMCSPMIGQFCDTMIVASIDKFFFIFFLFFLFIFFLFLTTVHYLQYNTYNTYLQFEILTLLTILYSTLYIHIHLHLHICTT